MYGIEVLEFSFLFNILFKVQLRSIVIIARRLTLLLNKG